MAVDRVVQGQYFAACAAVEIPGGKDFDAADLEAGGLWRRSWVEGLRITR